MTLLRRSLASNSPCTRSGTLILPVESVPAGILRFSLAIARPICSTVRLYPSNRFGSTSTIISRFSPPLMVMAPTPSILLSGFTTASSIISASAGVLSFAVTENSRMGIIVVLNLKMIGVSTPSGKLLVIRLSASRILLVASSRLAPHSNSKKRSE